MTKKKKILIWIVSILLGGALLYSGAWLYFYYAVCLPHMPAESYGFKIDEDIPPDPGLTTYYADIEKKYWTCFYRVPTFGKFCCSFSIINVGGFNENRYTIDENGNKDYGEYTNFSICLVEPLGLNGKIKHYCFDVSRCTQRDYGSYLIVNEKGELLNEDEQTAADLAIYREALPELMEFIETTNTMTGMQ